MYNTVVQLSSTEVLRRGFERYAVWKRYEGWAGKYCLLIQGATLVGTFKHSFKCFRESADKGSPPARANNTYPPNLRIQYCVHLLIATGG